VALRAIAELEKKDTASILKYPISEVFLILEFEKDRAKVASEMIKRK
jgi:hypothetical protein